MTKSRMTARLGALAGAVIATPAAGQSIDVDRLIDAQRAELRTGIRLECPSNSDDAEIVVCGAREDRRHRLPLPVEASPRSVDRAGGEQRAALAADSSRCTPVGRDQQCNGGLNVIGIGMTIARAIAQALANRD